MQSIRHTLAATIAATFAVVLLPPTIADARTIKLSEHASIHRVSHGGGGRPLCGHRDRNAARQCRRDVANPPTTVTGTVTFYPRGGSLTVVVRGKPESLSRVSGTMTVTRGTGSSRARGAQRRSPGNAQPQVHGAARFRHPVG